MTLILQKNFSYFVYGVLAGYILGSPTFMFFLITLISLALLHGKNVLSLYSTLKQMISSLNNHKIDNTTVMQIVNPNQTIEAYVNAQTLAKINEYCQWHNIKNIDFFIENAASLIFKKDKDWNAYQRSKSILPKVN